MENTTLARYIEEVQEMKNAVDDLQFRITDPDGIISKLAGIGLQDTYIKRDIVSMQIHLALYLKVARQTLDLWIQAKNIAERQG